MSKIEEQIKSLQRKQAKIQAFKALLSLEPTESPEHENLASEVKTEIASYVESKVKEIESGVSTTSQASAPSVFSNSEIEVLRTVAQRATQALKSPSSAPAQAPVQPKKTEVKYHISPLDFMKKYRHLEKQRVIVHTENGDVGGTVIGLQFPNVKVQTDTDFVIDLDPEKLTKE